MIERKHIRTNTVNDTWIIVYIYNN